MPNPRLLLCDTDSLIQLFLTRLVTKKLLPLRVLRDEYGIQPAIVEEVETELMWTRRYKDQFAPELKKALANGTIQPLNASTFALYVPAHLAKGVYTNFQALGLQHSKHADPGEDTLAAAVTLNEPALSNDASALKALDFNGFALPSPVLRAFDLFAFSYQIGALDEQECDGVRQELMKAGEHVPWAFQHASFLNGLNNFCPRLLDGGKNPVGAPAAPSPGYMVQILISRKS